MAATYLVLGSPAFCSESNEELYNQQVKPILRKGCYSCHGALKQEADLRLDTVNSMVASGVVEAGKPKQSSLLDRVQSLEAGYRMPPEHEGEHLTDEQIALIRNWILEGAHGPENEPPETDPLEHWAFQQLVRPDVPARDNVEIVNNPIDRFLHSRHEELNLVSQPRAPRLEQVRRLYFDLLGLPPTAAELEKVLSDSDPDWYAQLVNRLLADPRYGQRWARHWMDIWRYSDWWGLNEQLRNSQKNIWHWRDWIVDSLNRDLGYDEMIRCMLAADEIYPTDEEKLRATGYLARNFFLFNRNPWMEETVEHVGKGFLGLTTNCAKCHDHKYDPLTQEEYYQLRAFFEPYHVRQDVLPDKVNLESNRYPRVFDALPEQPTYLFVRGDESAPDQTNPLPPAIPSFLSPDLPPIRKISLPAEAFEPERRNGVLSGYIVAARTAHERQRMIYQAELEKSNQLESELKAILDSLEPRRQTDGGATLFRKSYEFGAEDWKLIGEGWHFKDGLLSQTLPGANRSLGQFQGEAPSDFEARLRFTIRGGKQWRSVGIGFDLQPSHDSDGDGLAGEKNEQQVYVSAHEGGPKVQAAFLANGRWVYPADGSRPTKVPMQQELELLIRVKGQIVNAYLNGIPMLSWQSPVSRQAGAIQFTAFDALVEIHEFEIQELQDQAKVYEPDQFSAAIPLGKEACEKALAKQKIESRVAEIELTISAKKVAEVESRVAAWQAIWSNLSSEEQLVALSHATTARDALDLAELELRQFKAQNPLAVSPKVPTPDALAKELQEIEAARERILNDQESDANQLKPITLQPFEGAVWSATRFLNSGKDDQTLEFPNYSSGRRTALAYWITDPRNPLTARVAVNHIWTRHMGSPLVATVFDFGRNGATPTNQELLDWLACELIESDWSHKHIHRLIVTSNAYRRSSSLRGVDPSTVDTDPENHHYWRFAGIRLESQAVRDSILHLAGKLDVSADGPPILPQDQDQSLRRSLYFFHSNNQRNRFLLAFDEATVKDCYRRETSVVPQQALALTNSRLVLENIHPIAKQLSTEATTDREFVVQAFRCMLGIEPNEEELNASLTSLANWKGTSGNVKSETQQQAPNSPVELKARARFVWVLINHNDFVTIR